MNQSGAGLNLLESLVVVKNSSMYLITYRGVNEEMGKYRQKNCKVKV